MSNVVCIVLDICKICGSFSKMGIHYNVFPLGEKTDFQFTRKVIMWK